MNNLIVTKTPIGTMEVDISSRRIVHRIYISNNCGSHCSGEEPVRVLYPNQIIFQCTIKDYMGEKGRIVTGWTSATTINDSLMDKITDKDSILFSKVSYALYPIEGGFSLI